MIKVKDTAYISEKKEIQICIHMYIMFIYTQRYWNNIKILIVILDAKIACFIYCLLLLLCIKKNLVKKKLW